MFPYQNWILLSHNLKRTNLIEFQPWADLRLPQPNAPEDAPERWFFEIQVQIQRQRQSYLFFFCTLPLHCSEKIHQKQKLLSKKLNCCRIASSCWSDVDQSCNFQGAWSCSATWATLRLILAPSPDFPGTSGLGVPLTPPSPLPLPSPSSGARGRRRHGGEGGEGGRGWWWGQCRPSRRWWRPRKDTRAKWEWGVAAKNWLWP